MRRCKDAKMRKPTKYLQAQCHEDAKMRCCEDARHRLCPPSATVLDLLNEIISMETTGLMFRAKSGVEESSVLVTIFLSAKVGYDRGMFASR